jgi:phosphoglycolate phosphatase-like HAD superfamily hydrolase
MHPIYNYDIYIFDCDGVILDSNALKIKAMRESLTTLNLNLDLVTKCIDYFTVNFGKSRFHHVAHFLDNVLCVDEADKKSLEKKILDDFSKKCRILYLTADITPGFIEFLNTLKGKKYVASGSEQNELRDVFKLRGLNDLFENIYGSPTPKVELVAKILQEAECNQAVMFGDAISDMKASLDNQIDFVAYLPYSNVKSELQRQSLINNFSIINNWI